MRRYASSPFLVKCLGLAFFYIFASKTTTAQTPAPVTYPKIVGYASVANPIVTFDQDGSSFNFNGSYTIVFPFGINLLKSDRIGFSFELAPTIKFGQGSNKVTNLVFHPGLMLRRRHGFTFVARMAFETAGRYGATAVFNQVIINRPNLKYFIAIPVPIRFGNDKPASISLGLQMGIIF